MANDALREAEAQTPRLCLPWTNPMPARCLWNHFLEGDANSLFFRCALVVQRKRLGPGNC